jgi:hypothetical protein
MAGRPFAAFSPGLVRVNCGRHRRSAIHGHRIPSQRCPGTSVGHRTRTSGRSAPPWFDSPPGRSGVHARAPPAPATGRSQRPSSGRWTTLMRPSRVPREASASPTSARSARARSNGGHRPVRRASRGRGRAAAPPVRRGSPPDVREGVDDQGARSASPAPCLPRSRARRRQRTVDQRDRRLLGRGKRAMADHVPAGQRRADGETRTPNRSITSRVRCQLRHAGEAFSVPTGRGSRARRRRAGQDVAVRLRQPSRPGSARVLAPPRKGRLLRLSERPARGRVRAEHARTLPGVATAELRNEPNPASAGGRSSRAYAGCPSLVGPTEHHLLGEPVEPWPGDGDTLLPGCVCGSSGCRPLTARVDVTEATVTWSGFRTGVAGPPRPGPVRLPGDQDEQALANPGAAD